MSTVKISTRLKITQIKAKSYAQLNSTVGKAPFSREIIAVNQTVKEKGIYFLTFEHEGNRWIKGFLLYWPS
jgi:hypothetical protein